MPHPLANCIISCCVPLCFGSSLLVSLLTSQTITIIITTITIIIVFHHNHIHPFRSVLARMGLAKVDPLKSP